MKTVTYLIAQVSFFLALDATGDNQAFWLGAGFLCLASLGSMLTLDVLEKLIKDRK